MHRCKDVDNSESCMNEYLLAYPVCLKCYCPYIMAKTCQASDFVFWIAE